MEKSFVVLAEVIWVLGRRYSHTKEQIAESLQHVVTADGIDKALKLGLNFPRGPFEAAALHGAEKVRETLAKLEATAPPHLKTRYLPPLA